MVDKFGNVLNAGDTVLFTPDVDSKFISFEGVLQEMHNGLYLRDPYSARFCHVFMEDDGLPCYELTKIQS